MNRHFEHNIKRVMSGQARGIGAAMLRGGLRLIEPFYAAAAGLRNRSYERQRACARSLPRPVVSVGNITTGGTGKTPMVHWLAGRLRAEGRHVAILSRGYRSTAGGLGDELSMLDRMLNTEGQSPVRVQANPDRFAAGNNLLREHPETDVFLLDDGFQHRRLRRNLDIVLVNATEPFGFGHVLPRGLLREPLSALARADAFVITHADRLSVDALGTIESELRRFNPSAPVVRARHVPVAILHGNERQPLERLRDESFFGFCGIGSPAVFDAQLSQYGPAHRGTHRFGDHHDYTPSDLQILRQEAADRGARRLVTTEKDWVKIEPLAAGDSLPVWRVEMRLDFIEDGEARLWDQVRSALRG